MFVLPLVFTFQVCPANYAHLIGATIEFCGIFCKSIFTASSQSLIKVRSGKYVYMTSSTQKAFDNI